MIGKTFIVIQDNELKRYVVLDLSHISMEIKN